MKVLTGVRGLVVTALAGALLGYVISAFAGPVVAENPLFGGATESPQARAFMVGLMQSEPEALLALTPSRDVVSRAMQYKQMEELRGQLQPVSLTYLGGRGTHTNGVHIYAVELREPGRGERFFPLVLTLRDGKVVRQE
jgi:hypothetical protein